MIGAPISDDLAPGDADNPFNDTDGDRRVLQNGTLLDVKLQVGGDRTGAVPSLTFVANTLQLIAERGSVAIGPSVDILRREAASHGTGGEHRRFETNPLLVRPVDELQWAAGHHAGIVERAHDLQGTEDTIGAVVATATA